MFYKHESCGQCTPCREVCDEHNVTPIWGWILLYMKTYLLIFTMELWPGHRLDEHNDVEIHWRQRTAWGDRYDLGTEQTGKIHLCGQIYCIFSKQLISEIQASCLKEFNTTSKSRLRATPSVLLLTVPPGQSRDLSDTSGQSWKTGKYPSSQKFG